MPKNEIEKQYYEIKKKYTLPEFKELDSEFEISDLEETNFLLRAIVRRIAEKLDFYSTMLEEILQPDTSNLYAMHETRFFDEKEKNQMYDLYRKLMNYNRQSIEVSIKNDERELTDFITSFFSIWVSLKNELLRFVKTMKNSWETETDVKEDLRYLG